MKTEMLLKILSTVNVPELLLAPTEIVSPSVEIDLEFGQASDDCQGFGICQIIERDFSNSHLTVVKCNRVPAVMKRFTLYQHRCYLELNKSDLCDKIVDSHLSNYLFRMDESYIIPEYIRARLQLNKQIIRKGYYLIMESHDDYKILF